MTGYSWFRANNNAAWHPKFARLDELLSEPNTLAYVFRAWCWCSAFAARGEWAPELDGAFESACGWRGNKGDLVRAMVSAKLIDLHDDQTREMHDWWELQGKAVQKAEKDAKVKRDNRAAQRRAEQVKNGAKTARAGRARGAQTAPARNETRRDETEQSSSYEDDGPASPSSGVDLFDWFQVRRVEGGWAPEKAPPSDELDEFFDAAAEQLHDTPAGTREALEVASQGYSRDPYWLKRALPWAGFVDQWPRHVRKATQQTMPLGVLGAVGS